MDNPRPSDPALHPEAPHPQRPSSDAPDALLPEIHEIRELIRDVRQLLDHLCTPSQHPA